jgi:hypothetical protein
MIKQQEFEKWIEKEEKKHFGERGTGWAQPTQ